MLEAVRLARSYVEGLGKADFLEDRKTQQAVILNILVVGEAATKIANEYPDFVAGRPDIAFTDCLGHINRNV